MSRPPLNGSKTHPLTEHAYDALQRLTNGAIPQQEINPGVVNRLDRDGLIETIHRPSPYKTHKFKLIAHIQITDAGLAALAARDA